MLRSSCIALSCVALCATACKVNDNPTSNREGAYYHLDGSSSGLLADFTDVSCLRFAAGNTTLSEPHLEVQIRLGDNPQTGEDRFSTFLTILLAPLPSEDRIRNAAVVRASTNDVDYTTKFELGFVAAEYEYGVPLQGTTAAVWINRLTIPEQTFTHPRDGEITLSGELDHLILTCNTE